MPSIPEDELIAELSKLKKPYEYKHEYPEPDEWLNSWDRGFDMKELVEFIHQYAAKACINDLESLGFDRRLDNPTLYCTENGSISIDERIKQLKEGM